MRIRVLPSVLLQVPCVIWVKPINLFYVSFPSLLPVPRLCTVPSLLMHSAIGGDPWWGFGASKVGMGRAGTSAGVVLGASSFKRSLGVGSATETHPGRQVTVGNTGNTFPFFVDVLLN